jgi:hypothetical protein
MRDALGHRYISMIRIVFVFLLIILSACTPQRRHTFDEFLRLSAFQAEVVGIVDLPGPPTFDTALSGPDRRFVLRTKVGETIVLDKVPTSLWGNFCGTIDSWLPIKEGGTYTFPEVLQPRSDCTKVFAR